jgi:molybdenum cofactor cytidylyltransferase
MTEVAALVLAAGRGTRFGAGATASKVLAPLDGLPLIRHVAEAALASRAREVVVVTGHAGEAVAAALVGSAARVVHNPSFAEGMATSLRAGVAALDPRVDGVVVLLADMPRVTRAIIDALIATFEADADAEAVVPERHGRRGNPVLIARALFPAVAMLEGDQGARRLLARPDARVLVREIDDDAIEQDVDTPEALDALTPGKAQRTSG